MNDMLNMILLDEMPDHNTLMQKLLSEIVPLVGETANFYTAQTREETISFAENSYPNSVYFLDIELENGDSLGIDTAYKIHELDPNGYIVYVSAHQQYAMDCLHSHVFDFLSKPVSTEELTACLRAILADMHRTPQPSTKRFWISDGGRDVSVKEHDITQIRCKGNFCEMVVNRQFYRWKEPLKSVEVRLQDDHFMKVSRQILLNLSHITSINWPYRKLTLDNGEEILFSRSVSKELKQKLTSVEVIGE